MTTPTNVLSRDALARLREVRSLLTIVRDQPQTRFPATTQGCIDILTEILDASAELRSHDELAMFLCDHDNDDEGD